MAYPWLKVIHVFFVISWFAGLFYLPRIFVNLATVEGQSGPEYERLLGMARRLKRFMLPLMLGTWIFGLALTFTLTGPAMWWSQGWLHAKLLMVLCLTGYDGFCSKLLCDFQFKRNARSHVWFRWFNEIPVFFLLAILVLVIVRPF